VKTVTIVDYGLCNLDSVRRAVEELGASALVTDRAVDVDGAERLILPGVGAYPDAMRNLRRQGLDRAMGEAVFGRDVPFLGICLGMQLLASKSLEGGSTEGLGWIDGDVRLLEPGPGARVPHVGWNDVVLERASPLFRGVAAAQDFYFVHSYAFRPASDETVVGRTWCGADAFAAAVQRDDRIFGLQFHPEKSQRAGFQIVKNFLEL